MTDKDREKLNDLLAQITEILPEFDAVMLSEGALILTSMENLESLSESIGFELDFEEDPDDFLKMLDYTDDDDDNGGMLQWSIN